MPNKFVNRMATSLELAASNRDGLKRSAPLAAGDRKSTGSTSKRYRALLTCSVCDGDAHGYNFDAISCESCKAFFRRNALQPGKLKCRGNKSCDVSQTAKKRCKKCRLEKCLRSGMRKEWILTDKERNEKRAKIEENRRRRQMHDNNEHHSPSERILPTHLPTDPSEKEDLLDLFPLFNTNQLNDFDWFMIRFYQAYYTDAVKLNEISGIACYPSTQPIDSTSELFRIPLYISAMRLISFVKQTNEFQELSADDQVHLIKCNLLTTCFFHSIYIYDPRTDRYHEDNTTDPLFAGKDWVQTLTPQFHREMKQLRHEFIDIFQMDDIVIKLFFLIILFSSRLSLTQADQYASAPPNPIGIFKTQNVFIELAYKYCVNQYGCSKACLLFSRYLHKLMKLQDLVDDIKYHIEEYVDLEQLSPLMQSLMI